MSDFPISRRTLLKAGSLAALALAAGRAPFAVAGGDALPWPIGLQLHTLSKEMGRDALGTLKQVAALGITEVECVSVPGKSAAELRRMLDDLGLRAISYHGVLGKIYSNPERQIEDAKTLGVEYLVCPLPWVQNPARVGAAFAAAKGDGLAGIANLFRSFTDDDWKWNADSLNAVGEKSRSAGIQMAYHNHGIEFALMNGNTAYDELLRLTDPALVTMELDCAWVVNAGQDPVRYLEKYPGRIRLLHVKDVKQPAMKTDLMIQTTEVGKGVIAWQPLLQAARKSGVRHCLIEQEPPFERPAIESVAISQTYLKGLRI